MSASKGSCEDSIIKLTMPGGPSVAFPWAEISLQLLQAIHDPIVLSWGRLHFAAFPSVEQINSLVSYMLFQGSSLWVIPAGRPWNAVSPIINTQFYAVSFSRWIYHHVFRLDRGQPLSLRVCPHVLLGKLASFPLSEPSCPRTSFSPVRSWAQCLEAIDARLTFGGLEGLRCLVGFHLQLESLQPSHLSNTSHLCLTDHGGHRTGFLPRPCLSVPGAHSWVQCHWKSSEIVRIRRMNTHHYHQHCWLLCF